MKTATHRPILLGTVERTITREEWLTLRLGGIGGSEAAAVAGASEWASPMSVYLQKVGAVPPTEVNEAMEWGLRLEPAVIAKFEEQSGRKVIGRQRFFRHPVLPFMLATIDGRYKDEDGEWCLFEGKTTSAWNDAEWRDECPLHIWVQVQHDLAVMGYRKASVAVLIGGQRFVCVPVARSDEYIERLVEREREFYERHMLPQIPPPVDGSDASTEALKMLYPEADGTELEPLPDEEAAERLVSDYLAWRFRVKEDEKQVAEAENALKAMLGEAEAGTAGTWRVSWTNRTRRGLDAKALTAAHPAIAEEFTKETTYRQFAVKELKRDDDQ